MKKVFAILCIVMLSACTHEPMHKIDVIKKESYFFFDYNSYYVNKFNYEEISKAAYYLKHNPDISVRLEGNADVRGTREYNYNLGYARAEAIANELIKYGAKKEQIILISNGKDKPIASGYSEGSHFQNRRVDLTYRKTEEKSCVGNYKHPLCQPRS